MILLLPFGHITHMGLTLKPYGKLPNAQPPSCHGSTTMKILIFTNLANSILTTIIEPYNIPNSAPVLKFFVCVFQ